MSEVVIDQYGKVEIPPGLRAMWGLTPGQRLLLEADEAAETIHLRPLPDQAEVTEPRVIEENGFLVIVGGAGVDIAGLIEQDREDRMQALMEGIPQ